MTEPSLLKTTIVVMGVAGSGKSTVAEMLAERLGLPQVTLAAELTVDGDTVRIRRDGEDAVEDIEATLPAVVSVTDQINEPRYPSFKGIMAAKKKPFETLSLEDLGVEPEDPHASRSIVLALSEKPPREAGTKIVDDGDAGEKLAEFLVQNRLV